MPDNHQNGTPAYKKIQATIVKRIESGHLKPGDAVESERELAKIHRVSLMTARHALTALEREGVARLRNLRGASQDPLQQADGVHRIDGGTESQRLLKSPIVQCSGQRAGRCRPPRLVGQHCIEQVIPAAAGSRPTVCPGNLLLVSRGIQSSHAGLVCTWISVFYYGARLQI